MWYYQKLYDIWIGTGGRYMKKKEKNKDKRKYYQLYAKGKIQFFLFVNNM